MKNRLTSLFLLFLLLLLAGGRFIVPILSYPAIFCGTGHCICFAEIPPHPLGFCHCHLGNKHMEELGIWEDSCYAYCSSPEAFDDDYKVCRVYGPF